MQQDVTEQVYKGSWPDRPEPPFWEVVPQDRVSEETFKYVTHLVSMLCCAVVCCAALWSAVLLGLPTVCAVYRLC